MKKIVQPLTFSLIAISALALLGVPMNRVLAKLPLQTTLESIPAESKYAPPCERGDFLVGNVCVDRRRADSLRTDAMLRRRERIELRQETHRTQREIARSVYLHPTGVRAASYYNGFELLKPNSRQYRMSETTIQTNLRNLRAKQRAVGAAKSRTDTTPRAKWTTRTKQNYFWNPTNRRVRRGLRM